MTWPKLIINCGAPDNSIVTKNACADIPDIRRPPWNIPGSLSLNATGDVASNATYNNTLPQNELQLSSSSGSLLQGMPANLVDMS